VPNQPTRNEQAIRASELSYRRLFEAAKDGIPILGADTVQTVDARSNSFVRRGAEDLKAETFECAPVQNAGLALALISKEARL
jgi:hypothetical protein